MLLLNRALLATPLVAAALGALLSSTGVAAHVLPRMFGLHSRQLSVRDDCVDVCDESDYVWNACTDATAAECCTVQNIDLAVECVDCLDVADGQELINNIATACSADGYPVGFPTVMPVGADGGYYATATMTGTAYPTGKY